VDVLTDVISTIRIKSALYARVEARAPWGIGFEVKDVIKFCLVARGNCCLVMEESGPLFLAEGDFFLTTGGAKYSIRDLPQSPFQPVEDVLGRPGRGVGELVRIGGTGASTTLLNGLLAFDMPDGAYFLKLLPQLIVIRREQAQRSGFAIYLERLRIEAEDETPGAQLVSNWLGGILFVHAIRAYAAEKDSRGLGWLSALSDRQIASALHAMHKGVANRWTVRELAAEAGMSRSGFAERFRDRVGTSPLEYLADWRMHLAMGLLRDHSKKLSLIAANLGYESEVAFSKAFKKRTGFTPSAYRHHKR
jgi:AraC-like DNA-binding protein